MPRFITLSVVLRIHDRQIERYGGSSGIRDLGLLESALAQPESTFGGELLHPTIAAQTAAYLYHVAKNHPFVDGNKRTSFAIAEAFLRGNNYHLNLTPEQAFDLTIQVAQSEITKEDLTEFLDRSIAPRQSP